MRLSTPRRAPLALIATLLALSAVHGQSEHPAETRMRKDVTFLASAECEGRGIQTQGIHKAADYVAAAFTRAGLKPGAPDGSYFQPFTVFGQSQLAGKSALTLTGPLGQKITLRAGSDFQVMGLSGSGKLTAPLVFVGHGATAPNIGYDDYKGIDVAGKIVVLLRRTPRHNNEELPFDGARKDEHAALVTKQALAESNKAAAVILVNDRTDAADALMNFGYVATATPGSVPAVQMRRDLLNTIFLSSLGIPLEGVEQAIDRDLKPRGAPLPGWSATVETAVKRDAILCKNIVGVAEGSGPLAGETIVIGAHYDHLGYGGSNSQAKQGTKAIHHGADDNASGTTALIELVRRFTKDKDRQGRRLVFIAFSAEESGLLGSQHYCNKQPLFPLADTAAMVNLDMVGRLVHDKTTQKPKLIVEGTGTAKGFDKLIDRLNPGFQLTKNAGGRGPSDHDSFYAKKVPVIFLWTGTHVDYHKPSDTADKINVAGMRKIADLAEDIVKTLSTDMQRPEYVYVAPTFKSGQGKSGPRLGIMPNYAAEKEGVLVGGVTADGPAAKGGLKEGDLIVEMAGKSVKNINTYMVIMAQQRVGAALEVGVIRDGKKLVLKVVPQ